jgi:hypothetical protein
MNPIKPMPRYKEDEPGLVLGALEKLAAYAMQE